jgi:large subunit ribosomal protein L28
MPGVCGICDRKPSTGNSYVRRGLAKAKGGVGRKITGKTGRWFRPNLQHLKIQDKNGTIRRAWVCTKCLRGGKITKAPKQKVLAQERAEKAEAKTKKK